MLLPNDETHFVAFRLYKRKRDEKIHARKFEIGLEDLSKLADQYPVVRLVRRHGQGYCLAMGIFRIKTDTRKTKALLKETEVHFPSKRKKTAQPGT